MLEMAVSIQDLGVFLLFVALMVALVYLIVVLRRVSDLLNGVHRVVSVNEKAVSEFFATAPHILHNYADITDSLRKSMRYTEETVPGILRNVEGVTSSIATVGSGITQTVAAVQASASDIGTYMSIASEAARVVMGFVSQNKKKRR